MGTVPRARSLRAVLRAAALGFAAIAVVAAGCTSSPPSPPPVPPPPPTAVHDAAPPADAGTTAAASSDAAPAPTVRELPPRRGAPGSTRGTIACGEKRCDATREKCVTLPGPVWACTARESTDPNANDIFLCDDGTDCPWGQTCCMSFASANTAYVCATRREGQDCKMEVCEPGGARCPAGQACKEGFCRPEKPPGPLCGRAACTGDTPYCLWSRGKGTCATAAQAQEASEKLWGGGDAAALLHCTRNSDCGEGMKCCTGGGLGPKVSHCSLNCDLINSAKYCTSDAECPTLMGTRMRCLKPDADLPPWSRLCLDPR